MEVKINEVSLQKLLSKFNGEKNRKYAFDTLLENEYNEQ